MNKWATIAGIVLIAGFCALGVMELMQSHIPYVTTVPQVQSAQGKAIQFMGAIVQDSIKSDTATAQLRFQLRDASGRKLPVRYDGVKPANFDSAERAVVVGKYASQVFVAEQVLTSCPSKYKGK